MLELISTNQTNSFLHLTIVQNRLDFKIINLPHLCHDDDIFSSIPPFKKVAATLLEPPLCKSINQKLKPIYY